MNNVSTVVATRNGDVLVFHNNTYSTVTSRFSPKKESVMSMDCYGGAVCNLDNPMFTKCPSHIQPQMEERIGDTAESSEVVSALLSPELRDSKTRKNVQISWGADDLVVFILTSGSLLYVWSKEYASIRSLVCMDAEPRILASIVTTPNDTLAVTNLGEVVKLKFYDRKMGGQGLGFTCNSLSHLHRVTHLFSDPKGNNFGVLSSDGFPPTVIEDRSYRAICQSLGSIKMPMDAEEYYCDVIVRSNGVQFPAHKMVLASQSLVFRRLFCPASVDENDFDILDIDEDEFDEMCTCQTKPCFPFPTASDNLKTEEISAADGQSNKSDGDTLLDKTSKELHSKKQKSKLKAYKNLEKSCKVTQDGDMTIVDIPFISADILKELFVYFYSGYCRRVKFPDYLAHELRFTGEPPPYGGELYSYDYIYAGSSVEAILEYGNFSSYNEFLDYLSDVLSAGQSLEVYGFEFHLLRPDLCL